jgi:hypothetical protein
VFPYSIGIVGKYATIRLLRCQPTQLKPEVRKLDRDTPRPQPASKLPVSSENCFTISSNAN